MIELSWGSSPRRFVLAWIVLAVAALPAVAQVGTVDCGTGSPAFPVPQIRQGALLWPPNGFQPATPGVQIPDERDSTEFVGSGFQLPGADSGLELFTDIDIAGSYA